ncbi:cation-transporting P-type ATPase [Spiroplasma sp. DGKH1]|uniref:P-type ATPase n=1 Tax=Spiroplasma sp. DGKH1 TaxID=3050074 RepID=UPI0034C6271E
MTRVFRHERINIYLKEKFFNENKTKLIEYAKLDQPNLLNKLELASFGLTKEEYQKRKIEFGENILTNNKMHWGWEFLNAFCGPFKLIFWAIIIGNLVVYFTNRTLSPYFLVGPILFSMILIISGMISFTKVIRRNLITKKIGQLPQSTAKVIRNANNQILQINEIDIPELIPKMTVINLTDIVPGDLVFLETGDFVPSDLRILISHDLYVNQANITGNNWPVKKEYYNNDNIESSLLKLPNICLMGSTVVSGFAIGIVTATGCNTYLAAITNSIIEKHSFN